MIKLSKQILHVKKCTTSKPVCSCCITDRLLSSSIAIAEWAWGDQGGSKRDYSSCYNHGGVSNSIHYTGVSVQYRSNLKMYMYDLQFHECMVHVTDVHTYFCIFSLSITLRVPLSNGTVHCMVPPHDKLSFAIMAVSSAILQTVEWQTLFNYMPWPGGCDLILH